MSARILIVEDEAPLTAMLRYNFEREGYSVTEAGDGEAAMARIAEAPAGPGGARLDAAGDLGP